MNNDIEQSLIDDLQQDTDVNNKQANGKTYHAVLTGEQSWCTPLKLVESVRNVYNDVINLDPCSNDYSIVNAEVEYKLPEHDGLNESWNYEHVYVNPPYGRDKQRKTSISDWMKKTADSHNAYNNEIICLIPVATNTKHWKKYVFPIASSICFLYDTRLRFSVNGVMQKKGAPMPCCMIYYGDNIDVFMNEFSKPGACIRLNDSVLPDVDDNGNII